MGGRGGWVRGQSRPRAPPPVCLPRAVPWRGCRWTAATFPVVLQRENKQLRGESTGNSHQEIAVTGCVWDIPCPAAPTFSALSSLLSLSRSLSRLGYLCPVALYHSLLASACCFVMDEVQPVRADVTPSVCFHLRTHPCPPDPSHPWA